MDVDVSAMGDDARGQVEGAVCGIDPGVEKFGLAICGTSLILSAVMPAGAIGDAVRCIADGRFDPIARWICEGDASVRARVSCVCLGSGTGRALFESSLTGAGVEYVVVDEHGTTLEARGLYWSLHPPRFPLSLVPRSLLLPRRPIDDLAAWAIALKFLKSRAAIIT